VTVYVGLLRAVNVGGTAKLPMTELASMCESAGFTKVKTYIASGNVVFESAGGEAEVKAELERRLALHVAKPVGVLVRTGKQLEAVLRGNPFPGAPPSRTVAIFLDEAPAIGAIEGLAGRLHEEVALGTREIYVHYVNGIGVSKLKVPGAATGTARNMNTVAKLVQLTRGAAGP